MINVRVLGCGPIRTGNGAAAPFNGVHILGEIRPAGGFDTLAESRWEDQIGPSILVQKSTISQSTDGGLFLLANRPWDRVAALFVATEIRGNIRRLGGGEAWPIGDRANHFNGSARSYSINTPQSTLVRLGGG
jgi:hypothetical protein